MACVLRITGVGLFGVGWAAVAWVVAVFGPRTGWFAEVRDHWLDLLVNLGIVLLVPWIAAGAGGVLWAVGRLARPGRWRGWAGPPLRLWAAATFAVGAVAWVGAAYFYCWLWVGIGRHSPEPDARVWRVLGHPFPPNLSVAWITLGVAGLLRAAADAAYPTPPSRRPNMSSLLRTLAAVLLVAGVVGFLANAAVAYVILTGKPWQGGRVLEYGYSSAALYPFLSLTVAGLGGVLWAGTRLAYPAATPTPPEAR